MKEGRFGCVASRPEAKSEKHAQSEAHRHEEYRVYVESYDQQNPGRLERPRRMPGSQSPTGTTPRSVPFGTPTL